MGYEIKYRRRDLSRILLEKCKLSQTFLFSSFREEKRFHDSCHFEIEEQRERNKNTEGILPWRPSFPSSSYGNSSTTCVLQVHTDLARHRFTRVPTCLEDALECSLAHIGYSRFNASLDRRLTDTYRKYSRRFITPRIFPRPKRWNIWSRRRGNSRGTPFLGLLNLGGRFRSTGARIFFPIFRGYCFTGASERNCAIEFLRFSNRCCPK